MSLIHFTCISCGESTEGESTAETSAWSASHQCAADVGIRRQSNG